MTSHGASSEMQLVQLYSHLFNRTIAKDQNYWTLFFTSRFHYVSLNSTFHDLNPYQVKINLDILHDLFQEALKRLDDANSLNILRIFIRGVLNKKYTGDEKKNVILKVFGDIDELNDNIVKVIKAIKSHLSGGVNHDDFLKFSSFKLFCTCVKSFYNTIVFECFYQIDLSDELYEFFMIENLEFEIIGELLVTLSILNENSLISSRNLYALKMDQVFQNKQLLSNINYQLRQLICFGLLVYHDMKPDLLDKKEQHSTFYNWITFNRYNVKVNDFKTILLQNIQDDDIKLFTEIKIDRFHKKNELLKEMLPVYIFLQSFVINCKEYGSLLTTKTMQPDELELFETYLSLTSFILQYQESFNVVISRVSLLTLYRLVSTEKQPNLQNYFINQYQVKLCYQRHPIVEPVGEIEYLPNGDTDDSIKPKENEMVKNKNSLYYILDVVQCQLRYNLSKKLDLISYKLCNLIILKVINDNGINYEVNYNWHGFFRTIFQTLLFLIKNFEENQPKIQALIEEILIILELLLVNLSVVAEGEQQQQQRQLPLVELIYKILENHEKLLPVIKSYTQQGENLMNFTVVLNVVMTKIVENSKDMNYNEIYASLFKFVNDDEEFDITDTLLYSKIMKGDVLFEHNETFKYLSMGNSIFKNHKISMMNKGLEQLLDDYRLFY